MPSFGWWSVTKGVLAILTWIALYFLMQWLSAWSRLAYFVVALLLAVLFWIVLHISPRAMSLLTNGLGWLFDVYEEKIEWVVYFLLVLMAGAVVCFILFAPYGVLCQTGLRACGN